MDKGIVWEMVHSPRQAVLMVKRLKEEGFCNEQIGILYKHNAFSGVDGGNVLTEALDWLIGMGFLTVPHHGSLVASEAVWAPLSGVVLGLAPGGICEMFLNMGVSEAEARDCERKIQNGNIFVSIYADDEREGELARRILFDPLPHDAALMTEESRFTRRKKMKKQSVLFLNTLLALGLCCGVPLVFSMGENPDRSRNETMNNSTGDTMRSSPTNNTINNTTDNTMRKSTTGASSTSNTTEPAGTGSSNKGTSTGTGSKSTGTMGTGTGGSTGTGSSTGTSTGTTGTGTRSEMKRSGGPAQQSSLNSDSGVGEKDKLAAMSTKQDNVSGQDKKDAKEALNKDYSFGEKEQFQKDLQSAAEQCDRRLKEADSKKDNDFKGLDQRTSLLNNYRDGLKDQLSKLRSATSENWNDVQNQVQKKISELNQSADEKLAKVESVGSAETPKIEKLNLAELKNYSCEQKQELVQTLEKKAGQFDQQSRDLETQKSQIENNYEQKIAILKDQKEILQDCVNQVRSATQDNWSEVKNDIQQEIKDLEI